MPFPSLKRPEMPRKLPETSRNTVIMLTSIVTPLCLMLYTLVYDTSCATAPMCNGVWCQSDQVCLDDGTGDVQCRKDPCAPWPVGPCVDGQTCQLGKCYGRESYTLGGRCTSWMPCQPEGLECVDRVCVETKIHKTLYEQLG